MLVVTVDGTTFAGVLWRRTAELLELRGAEVLGPEGPTTVEGSVILDVRAVAWVQLAATGRT